MNEMNTRAVVGDNNPPDPLDEAIAPFGDAITEAENWLDGEPVTTEGQMKAVDKLAKDIRSARRALDDAKKSATAPLHDAWKAEIARWKPTEDDLDRIQKGLAALVDGYKRNLAAEKAEAKRKLGLQNNQELFACRKQERPLNKCVLDQLVRRMRTHAATREKDPGRAGGQAADL